MTAVTSSVVDNDKEIKTLLVKMQQGRVSGPMCCGFLRPGYCTSSAGETCGMEGLLEALQLGVG